MKMNGLACAGLALILAGGFVREGLGQEVGRMPLRIVAAQGQKLTYKNLFRMSFFTDGAKEIVASSGQDAYQLDLNWEWTQEETFKGEGGDSLVVATVTKASDMPMINRQTTTKDIYPWLLEDLKGMEVSWRVGSRGEVSAFGPVKDLNRLTLSTLVSELRLIAEGEFYPPLPGEPKGAGETWTGEREATTVYEEFQNFEARIKNLSTLKVKGMKKKGGRNCVEIEESRVVTYKGWLNTGFNAIILEGGGKGKGSWLFDAENGLVVEHQVRIDLEPKPTLMGETSQRNVETRLTIWVERKLEK